MIRRSGEICRLNTVDGVLELPIDEILWVGSDDTVDNSPCRVYSDRQAFTLKDRFEKVLPTLGSAFLFCLQRGAVNQRRIRSFEGNTITLDQGDTLTVDEFLARRYRDAFCRNLAQWVWED